MSFNKLCRRRHCGFSKNLPLVCCPAKGFDPSLQPVSTPGVRRRGGQSEKERSGGVPVLENFPVQEDNFLEAEEELDASNTVEGERHEEDFGEHLEFEYHEFPVFIGDYAISDEFP